MEATNTLAPNNHQRLLGVLATVPFAAISAVARLGLSQMTPEMFAHKKLKKPEKELRAQSLLEAAPDAMVVVDEMGKIVLVNHQTERLFGYQRDELVGRNLEDLLPERFRKRHRIHRTSFFDEAYIRPTGGRLELFGLRKGGAEFPVEVSQSPIVTDQGVLVTSAIRDITDRKLMEHARLRLAAIVESSDDAIISKDLDAVITSWNAAAQRIFGYTEEEALGQPIAILIPPELGDEENKMLARLRRGERIEHYETIRVTKTGKRVNVSLTVSPIRDANGKIVGYSKIARDITDHKQAQQELAEANERLDLAFEAGLAGGRAGSACDVSKRKRAEEALLNSEQRYRLLFEQNVAGVGIGSVDGRLLDCNDGWARILGYQSRDEVVGRQASEFYFHPAERQRLLDELLESQAVFSRELQMRRKDGSPVWVLFNAAALNSEHNLPILQSTMIDISEWKRAEEALSGMTRKLVEAQEQERARIGRELHDDINQRLAMLSVELDQLQQSPTEVQSRMQELRKELRQISDDIQALSHDLHSSKLKYFGAIAGMKSWCKEVADRHKINIAFRSDFSGSLSLDVGIPLFRVLQEAVNNSIKHSGEKRVEVELRGDAGEIHLIVRDSGKGFDVESAMRGKGLGLTSMRERVRLANGTIAIKSRARGGTNVDVCIPLGQRNNPERLSA